eukprot:CAMPEP_0113911564 /NCGR_PEP_ID=MMETSP0780_2-20120614/28308_1 /TAXON_ID=652834 /ORGANISM="Palpitomonas bilix" /LENGTH=35 /DNA_ID=CAMNT_0000908159 /DNA_START=156 /DNA_END=259 /DNA_ORIENTATION=- /assembly_acc=CAM_ASM_000599
MTSAFNVLDICSKRSFSIDTFLADHEYEKNSRIRA